MHSSAAQRRKVMIVRGTWDWNLVKIETDAGISGIGEAYWGPGVKDVILKILKPRLIGEGPMNVDKLYTKVLMRNAGAGAIGGAIWWPWRAPRNGDGPPSSSRATDLHQANYLANVARE